MKIQGLILVIVMVFLSVSFCCLGQDYEGNTRKLLSKEKKGFDSYAEDGGNESDYLFEERSLISGQDDYLATGQSDSFIDSYTDPSLEGYGYLSGSYQITEYGQPTEDFYYYHEPKIPSPPTPPNLLYQIIKRSREK